MRPLVILLTLLLTLSASGITSALAASTGDDCCADAEADDSGSSSPEPSGDGNHCPPLCHACACSPMFEQPRPAGVLAIVPTPACETTFLVIARVPTDPPDRDVFHPPRV